jgi:hypothetical protein
VPSLGVVHLARAGHGFEPLRSFLQSYCDNPGGVDHELVVILKGFHDEAELKRCRELLQPFAHRELRVSDEGLDLTAYYKAMLALEFDYYCFLNSFSILHDPAWLRKLYTFAVASEVGIVGATGSYESPFTDLLKQLSGGLSSSVSEQNLDLHPDRERRIRTRYLLLKRLLRGGYRTPALLKLALHFPVFPNYHVRTNAFVLRRSLGARLRWRETRSKGEAYLLESGRNGITAQVMRMGLRALVVGRDGTAYDEHQWHNSNTFWHGDQGNLLVEDNQTRRYAQSNIETRKALFVQAWGDRSSLCPSQRINHG